MFCENTLAVSRLPENVYQTAKVAKILQLMEKGNADEFKNKSLDQINIDMDTADIDPGRFLNK